jgi:probable phosphoglycerate mutase
MRIGLIRHGRTDWNSAGLLQGRTDRPLEAGEADRLRDLALPESWRGADIVASPLVRAFDTAEIIAGRAPKTDARLIEMSFGDWEGKSGHTLRDDQSSGFRDVEHWGWGYRPPNGETPHEVWERVSRALSDIETETTLIVCHMIVMRVVLAKAHGWNFEGPPPFKIKRDRIYGVKIEKGTFTADPEPVRLVSRCA